MTPSSALQRLFRDATLIVSILGCLFRNGAAPPPNLPGDEITQEILKSAIPRDTIGSQRVRAAPKNAPLWYDQAAKTWESAPLSEQMALSKTSVAMGMGGIFVPRFTEAKDEPDVEIMNIDGKSVANGKPGMLYSVEPGTYYVLMGSGSHRQRIVRKVSVTESKTTPVLPDWSGLIIETVDSTTIAFRGEYELVRIDEFEPFGRGFGADPELGESQKPWILKPGIYKILGRGEGYNTLRNFITVRLLPGELTSILLIQRPETMAIISGGNVNSRTGTRMASHWKYGINVGGNLQFNGEVNRRVERQKALNSTLSLRTGLWVRYNNDPYEWQSNLVLDEGINLAEANVNDFITGPDDFRLMSLVIWRFLPWFGPYGRAELRTNLLPHRLRLDETVDAFCILNADSTVDRFDVSSSFLDKPSFCPLRVDVDIGANVDAVNLRFLELKLRGGVGSSYNDFPNRYINDNTSVARYSVEDSAKVKKSLILRPLSATSTFEFGPQGSITGNVRIGRMATASGELRVFAPIVPEMRFNRPDFDLTSTLSWRLTRSITLDYDFTFRLKQPEDDKAKENLSSHKIYLRFSYSSR